MDITYDFEVISVDEQARVMDVVYTNPDHGSYHVSARLPYEGEDLLDVIEAFSPVPEWSERLMPVQTVEVGTTGKRKAQQLDTPIYSQFLQTVDSLPELRIESLKALETIPLKNLKTERVFNSYAEPVAMEITGPSAQATVEQGAAMFNSITKLTNKAKEVGVNIIARSQNQNVIDFMVNTHGYTAIGTGADKILHLPINADTGKKFVFSAVEFIDRFTGIEFSNILSSSETNAQIGVFYNKLIAADFIDITEPRVSTGLGLLVSQGILSQTRMDELLLPVSE